MLFIVYVIYENDWVKEKNFKVNVRFYEFYWV